jgi:hypothetical protein
MVCRGDLEGYETGLRDRHLAYCLQEPACSPPAGVPVLRTRGCGKPPVKGRWISVKGGSVSGGGVRYGPGVEAEAVHPETRLSRAVWTEGK